MSELSPELDRFITQIFAKSRLQVEIDALEWPGGADRIKALHVEGNAIPVNLMPVNLIELEGLYRGFEEFSDLWILGEADPRQFVLAAINFIAREASQDAHQASTWMAMLSFYGEAVLAPMEAELRAMLADFHTEYRRLEVGVHDDDTGEERRATAAIGSTNDDPRFDEAYICKCGPDDEHAQLITIADIEHDALAELRELCEERWKAARRTLKGLPVA